MNREVRPALSDPIGECFDDVVLPHLDAAHRLARWLMRNEHDAEDVVQEASLRALRYFRTFAGGNGRAWFLRIVRNTCTGWCRQRVDASTDTFDEERHGSGRAAADPEALLIRNASAAAVHRALDQMPDRVRELLVLRELKGLSYREIADALAVPMGTVMSGLSRARSALRDALHEQLKRSAPPERTPLGTRRRRGTGVNRAVEYTKRPRSNGRCVCDSRSVTVRLDSTQEERQ